MPACTGLPGAALAPPLVLSWLPFSGVSERQRSGCSEPSSSGDGAHATPHAHECAWTLSASESSEDLLLHRHCRNLPEAWVTSREEVLSWVLV